MLRYPVFTLEQIYGTLSFYLSHEHALRGYVDAQRASETAHRDTHQPPAISRLRERGQPRRMHRSFDDYRLVVACHGCDRP